MLVSVPAFMRFTTPPANAAGRFPQPNATDATDKCAESFCKGAVRRLFLRNRCPNARACTCRHIAEKCPARVSRVGFGELVQCACGHVTRWPEAISRISHQLWSSCGKSGGRNRELRAVIGHVVGQPLTRVHVVLFNRRCACGFSRARSLVLQPGRAAYRLCGIRDACARQFVDASGGEVLCACGQVHRHTHNARHARAHRLQSQLQGAASILRLIPRRGLNFGRRCGCSGSPNRA